MTLNGMRDAIVYLLKRERDREMVERRSNGYSERDVDRIRHDHQLVIEDVEKKDQPKDQPKDTPAPIRLRVKVFELDANCKKTCVHDVTPKLIPGKDHYTLSISGGGGVRNQIELFPEGVGNFQGDENDGS